MEVDSSIQLSRHHNQDGEEVIVTILDYWKMIADQDQVKIAEFIFHRLHSRYLNPSLFGSQQYKDFYKNGFSILANCCLLIETLQSFRNGWEDSHNKSEDAFRIFFTTDQNFSELKSKWRQFYKNIRCGILHQGETTGGWKINREKQKLYDPQANSISAVLFIEQLEKSLSDYRNQLLTEKWDSETWDNLRVKMRRIISNCTAN